MYKLLDFYKHHFNLENAIFSKIEHDDALVSPVYKITLNNKQYILKVCTRSNDYLCETYFLKYFKDKIPVPNIIDMIEPKSNISGAILLEYLQGDLLKKLELTDSLAYQIGSVLAKIHSNKVGGYGDLTKPNQLNHDPASYFTIKFEEGLSECCHHLPKEIVKQCRLFYKDKIQLLRSTDGPCITHRDFRPGNTIVDKQKIAGIIDWSSARGSFAEEDFCSLDLNEWSDDPNKNKAFLEGYQSIRPLPDYHNVMSILLLNKAIATIGFTVKTSTWNNKNKCLYQRYLKLFEKILL